MRFYLIFYCAAILGIIPQLAWGQAVPDDLNKKGPPDTSQYSGMPWKLLLTKANQMYEIANLGKAMEYATQLTKSEPNIPGGWRISGLVKSDRREFDAAEKDLKKCIQLTETYFGKDVESLQYDYESLGYVYKRLNRLQEAIEAYKKAVAINPTRGYYIDQLVLACQWKYAKKYANFEFITQQELSKEYQLSELAEEMLIIREFRHTDGGRWALEEQKISIKGAKHTDHVTLSCERCNAIAKVTFHISLGSKNNIKRLEEVTDRYRTALKDEDTDIRTFAVSQLKLLEESLISAVARDPDPWVRLSALRSIEVDRPEIKYIKDFLVDSDPMVSRLAAKVAKKTLIPANR